MIKFVVVVGVAVFYLGGTCCATNHYLRETLVPTNFHELPSTTTLDDIIRTDTDLTTLATAFLTTNLNGSLCTQSCNFIAFAPTNAAFERINQTLLSLLLTTPNWAMHLIELLAFHITFPTTDRLPTTEFTDGLVLDMLNGEQVTVNTLKSGIKLSSPQTITSTIVEADLLASNGALNKIDSVLLPGFFAVNLFELGNSLEDFTTIQELFMIYSCNDRDGLYTILAPTNGAFLSMTDETLSELMNNTNELKYIIDNHIIPGVFPSNTLTDGQKLTTLGGRNITVSIINNENPGLAPTIRFNGVPSIQLDILAINGIAYGFESLIFDPDPTSNVPSSVSSDVPSNIPSDVPTSLANIFDLSERDPDFTILGDYFNLTGLDNLEGDYTLFAPENDAWFALGNATLARLRTNVAVLESLLLDHIVVGTVPPNDLIDEAVYKSFGGSNITVSSAQARAAAQQSMFIFNGAIYCILCRKWNYIQN